MRGRKPLPIELHELRGNPGRRPLPEPVPVPQGRPECPSHFDEHAKGEWEHACDLIEHMGVLSKADRCAVEMFVDTFVKYRTACQSVDKYGMVQCINADKKQFAINPFLKVRNTLWDQLYRMLGEFGFTPSARARLKMAGNDKPEEDDPLVAMLKARAGGN